MRPVLLNPIWRIVECVVYESAIVDRLCGVCCEIGNGWGVVMVRRWIVVRRWVVMLD